MILIDLKNALKELKRKETVKSMQFVSEFRLSKANAECRRLIIGTEYCNIQLFNPPMMFLH
jgi:hypothetical protein